MGLLYCIIAVLSGFLSAKVYAVPNMKMKVVVLILLPIVLNLGISLSAGLFVDNSLGYGYNVGSIVGLLLPATLAMMITLGICCKVKKKRSDNKSA